MTPEERNLVRFEFRRALEADIESRGGLAAVEAAAEADEERRQAFTGRKAVP